MTVVPDAILDVRYATADNFLKTAVYPSADVFLRKSTARRLKKAAGQLRKKGFRLIIFDGYRPLSVQKKMWEIMPDPRFVANPVKGSFHNRGGAVDVSLAARDGAALEMPSDYDDFTVEASGSGPLASPRARENLALLRRAMEAAGFKSLKEEWWHYYDPEAQALDF